MVCVPCIIIPVLLWVFHKYIQPLILKFWNPWSKKEAKTIDWDSLKTEESDYIKKKVNAEPVVLFSKTTCSFCSLTKDLLNEIGVNYYVEEINENENCEKLQEAFKTLTGERTVPRIFIGGKCVGGNSDACSLHNQGKLVTLCKDAGATFKKTD
ncbi:DgyrCDS7602 [Dimorphilus gyrociliatus]|uniref:Glutaredoxin-2, mitochondrial n=1 Tax=Dimorphilus gyrociliatus TaxID=2664684 RepID=A0A7I8VT76_9ANNE|nr:DgyrCDS7602 [Dimorphilus gyrociliatus]